MKNQLSPKVNNETFDLTNEELAIHEIASNWHKRIDENRERISTL